MFCHHYYKIKGVCYIKNFIFAVISFGGSLINIVIGGRPLEPLIILLVLMAADYFTGVVCAILKKSEKSENGGLSSIQGFGGLLKKMTILFMLVAAHAMDMMFHTDGDLIRNGTAFFYSMNEILSICENFVLMGIPVPDAVKERLEVKNENK